MAEQNGTTVHSKGSASTLKQKIKKRLGSSPTVARKGSSIGDSNSFDCGTAAGGVSGRPSIKVKRTDRRALETSEKSVNAAVQYMNIYCAHEQEKDYEQIPVLTEAIIGEVKKLLDVAESLTRYSPVGSSEERKRLLLALAELVCFADKSYMTENRANASTDPSESLRELSTAVKELVKRVEEIDDGKGSVRDFTPTPPTPIHDSTPTSSMPSESAMLTAKGRERMRHKSVPVVVGGDGFQLLRGTSIPSAGISASYSAENISEAELYRRMPISGSEGHLSVLAAQGTAPAPRAQQYPPPSHHPAGSLTPPPLRPARQHRTSPLAKRKSDTAFRFSTDSEVEDSPSDATSLSLSSHVPDEDDPEEKDKPPLPPKKRNSLGYAMTPEPPTSTTSSEFVPVYADERTKVQAQFQSGEPPCLRKRITPGVLPDVSSAAFRRPQHADPIPRGPMKAMGPLPNGYLESEAASFQETLARRIESAAYPPPLVVTALPHPDQVPPKKPPKTPRPISLQESSSSVATLSNDSRLSLASDLSSPSPPAAKSSRPPKPPRPSTPVRLPPESDEPPPPLPVKQKRAVAEYNALFGPYEGADDEYNSPLIISRPDVQSDVVKQQIAFGSGVVPLVYADHGRPRRDTVAGDVLPPLPEKQARKKRSRAFSCDVELEDESERNRRSGSDPDAVPLNSQSVNRPDGTLGVPDSPIYSQNVKDQLLFNEEDGGGASLKGGTVEALIAYAATASASGPDRLYYEAFLMTYRTFVPSETVVEKLLERHDFFLEKRDPVVCHHTLSVLMRVVDDLRGDVNKELLNRLVDVVYRLICDAELKLASVLRRSVIQKWKNLHEPRVSPVSYLLTKPDPNAKQKKLPDLKSRHIAEQMSLLDFKFFQNIETPEMLAWAEEQNEEKNPTLTSFTEHFNNVSGWCRTKLIENSDTKDRERVAQKLIKVMKHLREMNNFNSYLAILSAFDAAAISRLEWSDEVLKGLNEPHALIDNKASFKAYRTALKEAKMPCIPYLGMFLQDLTFIHLGNPGYVDDAKKHVNFNKRWRQFTVLEKIRKCQQTEYTFHRDEVIIRMFNGFRPYLGEEQLYQRSLKIKPRDF